MAELKETAHQCIIVRWWRKNYPHLTRCLQASGNGAVLGGNVRQRAIQSNQLKAMGMVVGQSDLFLAVPRAGHHGLYIELKSLSKSAKVSEEQEIFLIEMAVQGYKTFVCKGSDAAIEVIKNYMELK